MLLRMFCNSTFNRLSTRWAIRVESNIKMLTICHGIQWLKSKGCYLGEEVHFRIGIMVSTLELSTTTLTTTILNRQREHHQRLVYNN